MWHLIQSLMRGIWFRYTIWCSIKEASNHLSVCSRIFCSFPSASYLWSVFLQNWARKTGWRLIRSYCLRYRIQIPWQRRHSAGSWRTFTVSVSRAPGTWWPWRTCRRSGVRPWCTPARIAPRRGTARKPRSSVISSGCIRDFTNCRRLIWPRKRKCWRSWRNITCPTMDRGALPREISRSGYTFCRRSESVWTLP